MRVPAFVTVLGWLSCALLVSAYSIRAEEVVPTQIFQGPQLKEFARPGFPANEMRAGQEGWVVVTFMVDRNGKAYELVVTDSTGSPAFERAALRAIAESSFHPASFEGEPVDASHYFKVTFALTDAEGASPRFLRTYKSFMDALGARDRARAESALARMNVSNLYDDAYLGFAQYEHARVWGTEQQQLDALKRAIAGEEDARYLPESVFRSALEALLSLQIKQNRFGEALRTWDKLKKSGADATTLETWEKAIADIDALRTDARSFDVDGTLSNNGRWFHQMLKKQFRVQVASGRIQEIKLRCDTSHVMFPFDPEIPYRIADEAGECHVELIGEPGSQFKFEES